MKIRPETTAGFILGACLAGVAGWLWWEYQLESRSIIQDARRRAMEIQASLARMEPDVAGIHRIVGEKPQPLHPAWFSPFAGGGVVDPQTIPYDAKADGQELPPEDTGSTDLRPLHQLAFLKDHPERCSIPHKCNPGHIWESQYPILDIDGAVLMNSVNRHWCPGSES
jgi:hypothetical protein